MPDEVDLFVIGAGSGGVRAARIASGYGARVMIAEEYRVGGTCVIRGCVPKKLLVYASRFADEFEDAAGFGWTRAGADVRLGDADRQQGQGDRAARERPTPPISTAPRSRSSRAARCSIDPHTVKLAATGETVRAKHILIATGGCALARHGHRGPRARHLVERGVPSDGAAEAHPDPGRRLHRGRVRRHLQRPRLRGDAGLSRRQHPARLRRRRAHASAHRDGKARHQDHHQEDRRGHREGRTAGCASSCPTTRTIVVDKVMFATGRRPNVKGLGLEAAGVRLDENGAIAVNEFSQTTVPHIYAVGDVTDRIALTPVAIREGHAFADTVFGEQADAGRSHQRADRGVLRARGRRHRPDRGAGPRAARQGRHLQDHVPADEGDAVRPRHPHLHEARGRWHRPTAWSAPISSGRTPAR